MPKIYLSQKAYDADKGGKSARTAKPYDRNNSSQGGRNTGGRGGGRGNSMSVGGRGGRGGRGSNANNNLSGGRGRGNNNNSKQGGGKGNNNNTKQTPKKANKKTTATSTATVHAILSSQNHPKKGEIAQLWEARRKGWITDQKFNEILAGLVL